jgi:hypothetical protein
VRVQAISAGTFHSVVQTQKGDLYACGLNKDGQLGFGNKASKKFFCHLTCFAGINVQKFHAGGNHTWFLIDEFAPSRPAYSFPEPLTIPKTKEQLKKEREDAVKIKKPTPGAGAA